LASKVQGNVQGEAGVFGEIGRTQNAVRMKHKHDPQVFKRKGKSIGSRP
jgi:hypothetical protein